MLILKIINLIRIYEKGLYVQDYSTHFRLTMPSPDNFYYYRLTDHEPVVPVQLNCGVREAAETNLFLNQPTFIPAFRKMDSTPVLKLIHIHIKN